MSAKLVFLRRSIQEVSLYGGTVYFDINGINTGSLNAGDAFVEVPPGVYRIRMYKTHTYGSMVGFAETTVTVAEGQSLLFRYITPMSVNQPGQIITYPYTPMLADQLTTEIVNRIHFEQSRAQFQAQQTRRADNAVATWLIVSGVITGLLIVLGFAVYMFTLSELF